MKQESKQLEFQNTALKEKISNLKTLMDLKKGQLQNSLTGLASSFSTQDNITSLMPLFSSNLYAPITLNYTLLTFLYKSHGVLQTMIDEPVLDSFRDGLELTSNDLSAENISEMEDFMEERGIWEIVKSTFNWGRLYGGSGLIINVGQDPAKPLDVNDIKNGMLELYDADRWEFSGAARHAKSFLFYGQQLDASRVITFGGKRAPRMIRAQLSGWGMSELERAVEDFNMWLRGRNVLYEILDEAKVDVYSIDGYAATLALPDGESVIRQRVQATNQIKNFCNALILDKNDEYKVIPTQFNGLAEVMNQNRIGIASALRMPLTKLFGMTASGLNASSEDDIENYNAMITSQVREPAKPIIRKILRLVMLSVFGKEYDISFKFRPLRMIGAVEEEGIKTSKHSRYLSLYQSQVLSSKELGELMSKEGLVSIQTRAEKGELPENQIIVPGQEKLFMDTPVEVSTPSETKIAVQPAPDKEAVALAQIPEEQGGVSEPIQEEPVA
jgi:hypothetical protein